MQAPLHPFTRRARLLGYSLLGAGLYPVLAARVFARQRRRVSIPPAPASVFPRTDPRGTGAFSTLRAFMPDLAVYLSELEPEGSRRAYRYSPAFRRAMVDSRG